MAKDSSRIGSGPAKYSRRDSTNSSKPAAKTKDELVEQFRKSALVIFDKFPGKNRILARERELVALMQDYLLDETLPITSGILRAVVLKLEKKYPKIDSMTTFSTNVFDNGLPARSQAMVVPPSGKVVSAARAEAALIVAKYPELFAPEIAQNFSAGHAVQLDVNKKCYRFEMTSAGLFKVVSGSEHQTLELESFKNFVVSLNQTRLKPIVERAQKTFCVGATDQANFYDAMAILEKAAADPDATVVSEKTLTGGSNKTKVVTLSNGFKGVWKSVKGEDLDLTRNSVERDHQGRRETAAYIIDKELGHLAGVPPSVFRKLKPTQGKIAAFFRLHADEEEGALMTFVSAKLGKFVPNEQLNVKNLQRCAIFDEILGNLDRHSGNFLFTASKKIVPIDHGLCLPLVHAKYRGHFLFSRDGYLTKKESERISKFLQNKAEITQQLLAIDIDQRASDLMFERAETMLKLGATSKTWYARAT